MKQEDVWKGYTMNLKNLKHFKRGVKELSPTQLAEGRIFSYIGMSVGLIFVMGGFIMAHKWGWFVFMFFFLILQLFQTKAELQNRKQLKLLDKQLELMNNETDMNNILEGMANENIKQ